MARITESKKKMWLLLLCGLLLLTTEVSCGASEKSVVSTQASNNLNVSAIQPAKDLVSSIPSIITNLGRLASTSMQQLDTALSWPSEVPNEAKITEESSTSSPLIEYPQSFRTTVMQINQQLNRVLRDININADRMALQLLSGPSTIDTLNRYLSQYPQKARIFAGFLPLPLNGLQELSENIVLISHESASELQGVANLTKSFSETTRTVLSAKLQFMQNKLYGSFSEDLATKINQKNKFGNEVNKLNEEHERWSRKVTELEKKFYETLDTELGKLKTEQKEIEPSCVEIRLQGWTNIKDVLKIKDCQTARNENSTPLEVNAVNTIRAVKKGWKEVITTTESYFKIWTDKKEEYHNMSIAVQKLKHKKQGLDQDISLLSNTTDSITELRDRMEELIVGWNNLAIYGSTIQSDIATVRSTLLPDDTSKSVPGEEELREVARQLQKTREGMQHVGKIVQFYSKAYNSNISSLAAQLNQMMTISDESPFSLQTKLINAVAMTSSKIKDLLASEFPASLTPNQN